ncbi:MAG: hypothetical protein K1X94_29675 [Sandaracinaceae bacterium]|nr:hypothetical protein [Sandaracinaceae bacterium]
MQEPPIAATPPARGAGLSREVLLAAGASVLVAAVAAIVVGGPMDELCLDDAYIHMAYARSLRLGEGLSYNPGDWELGTTSPLWVLLLAILPSLSVGWVKALGVLLHALGAGVVSLTAAELVVGTDPARTPHAPRIAALVAGALFALHPLLLHAATSGMEVPLVVLLSAGATLATLRGALPLAAALAALSVWARLESIVPITLLTLLVTEPAGRPRAWRLAPALGGIAGLALLALYCELAQGELLPNTVYLKARLDVVGGLAYLALRVLRHEGWLVTIAGAAIVGHFVSREARAGRASAAILAGSWAITLVAIAVTRRLDLGIQFYGERYFAIAAFLPPLLVGAALACAPRPASLALVPIGIFLALALPDTQRAARAEERDIRLLHTEPAEWVGANLAPDAVVLVEGAGAMRFYTPRTMTILDLVGLNDRLLAHTDGALWPCVWIARRPSHVAIPTELGPRMQEIFAMSLLERRDDPAYSQVLPASERSLFVLEVRGVSEAAVAQCSAALGP